MARTVRRTTSKALSSTGAKPMPGPRKAKAEAASGVGEINAWLTAVEIA
jgi:hypothetical protein